MPCDTIRQAGETAAERRKKVDEALAKLRKKLAGGEVTLKVGPQGAVGIVGWSAADRNGVTDVCALRAVGSTFEVRQALMKAEAAAGRKVDRRMVAAGVHSHDSGKTWHKGH